MKKEVNINVHLAIKFYLDSNALKEDYIKLISYHIRQVEHHNHS